MSKINTGYRIDSDLDARLDVCGQKIGIPKSRLAESAILAAVTAIEHNGYKVVMPIEFEIKCIAVANPFPGTVTSKKSAVA